MVTERKKVIRIIVDAGHGGEALGCYVTPGKRSPEPPPVGVYEGVLNRWFARKFCEVAKAKGHEAVNLVGDAVIDISLKDRCKTEALFANKNSVFISFHNNALGNIWQDQATGPRVLYKSNKARKLAVKVAQELSAKAVAIKGWRSIYRQRKYLYVLKKTKSPALLIELSFMDNKEDVAYFQANVNDYIDSILKGLENGLESEGSND